MKKSKMSICRISPARTEPNEITDSNLSNNNTHVTLGPCNPTTGNRSF